MTVEMPKQERQQAPGWYLKAPKSVQEDADWLIEKLRKRVKGVHIGYDISEEERVYLIKKEKNRIKIFEKFGLFHEAILKLLFKFYNKSVDSVNQAREKIGDDAINERGVKKNRQNLKIYNILKLLVLSQNEYSSSFIVDSLMDIENGIYERGQINSDSKSTFLENFVESNSIRSEDLIEEIIKYHIRNIENRNRTIELDSDSVLVEPERVSDKKWKINKRTFVLHELKNDAELDFEGLMGDNCVAGDNWKSQIRVDKNGVQETRIFSLGWVFDLGKEEAIFDNLNFFKTGDLFAEQIMSEIVSEIFDDPDDTETLDNLEYDIADLKYETMEEFFENIKIIVGSFMKKYYARNWVYKFEKIKIRWEEIFSMKTRRLPLFTIEYDVTQKKVRQIKTRGNDIPSYYVFGIKYKKMLIEAIAEIHKKFGINKIEELDSIVDKGEYVGIKKDGTVVWKTHDFSDIELEGMIYPEKKRTNFYTS